MDYKDKRRMERSIEAISRNQTFLQEMEKQKKDIEQKIRKEDFETFVKEKNKKKKIKRVDDRTYMQDLINNNEKIRQKEEILKKNMREELKLTLDFQTNTKEMLKRQPEDNNCMKRPSSCKNSGRYSEKVREMEQSLSKKQRADQYYFNLHQGRKSRPSNELSRPSNVPIQRVSELQQKSQQMIEKMKEKLESQTKFEIANQKAVSIYHNKRPDKVIRKKVECTQCHYHF